MQGGPEGPADKFLSECRSGSRCFYCGQMGHVSSSCPSLTREPEDPVDMPQLLEGALRLFGRPLRVLVSTGSPHSFISPHVMVGHEDQLQRLVPALELSSPLHGILCKRVDHVWRSCPLERQGYILPMDLIPYELAHGIDVQLGMDMLSTWKAMVSVFPFKITVQLSNGEDLAIQDDRPHPRRNNSGNTTGTTTAFCSMITVRPISD